MIDIHCHILPEVDDGAKTWDIAVDMCRMAQDDGIEHIVATPHANHEYLYDRTAHKQRLDRLSELTGGAVQLSLGCDFHMSYENVQDALKNPSRYCIENTSYLLVEFSDFGLPPNVTELLDGFMGHGITPIITHPERNPIVQRQPQMVIEWVSRGAVIQVTANSMTGRWGGVARKTAEFLLKKNLLHVLATDAHGLNSRPPILSEAREVVRQLAGDDVAEATVTFNPQAIVEGRQLTLA